ncbi:Group II intron-encoded protein LtrA [Anaerolineae bacterium]|nr:Group II intron-encoded protein LtrA [Anaerolineae bacterium]
MLDQVLSRSNLIDAWEEVRANKGAPGSDAVTLKRWGRNWETNLERLRQQVRTNTYHPNRPRRFKVLKKDSTFRELSILTVTDRVLQRAVLNVLEPICEQRFLNCNFGYRPRRSVANAITSVVRWRERGCGWLLDADIEKCFDSLEHALILELLKPDVPDVMVLNLIARWLKAGTKPTPSSAPPRCDRGEGRVGVPLGAVLSPLLCNVVLHEMDAALTRAGWALVRYADDFVVLTHSEAEAQQAARETAAALRDLKLNLHPHKTQITSFTQGFCFLGVDFKDDTYAYVYQQKQIKVKGPNTRFLYDHWPQFY